VWRVTAAADAVLSVMTAAGRRRWPVNQL